MFSTQKKKLLPAMAAIALVITIVCSLCACGEQGFKYKHDPMQNPNAAKDIIVDETAVYGYSPNPESERLAKFVDYDWSDKEVVEKAKADRIKYHESITEMFVMLEQMRSEGKDIETIARAISAKRNEIRLAAYKDDPEGLANVKASNLEKYGNENGPTADSLYEKLGSWEEVLVSAFSPNLGMDACLGLYDTYYDEYVALGLAEE